MHIIENFLKLISSKKVNLTLTNIIVIESFYINIILEARLYKAEL